MDLPPPDSVPQCLGDFELEVETARGAMGTVYRGRQISMDRAVAIKVLSPRLALDRLSVERFYREARISAAVDHPNIVRGIAVGEQDGFHYFAMEWIDGDSLADRVRRGGALPPSKAARLMRSVAEGLAFAHAKGLVHRDIKPANVVIGPDEVPKLVDLGLSQLDGEDLTLTQQSPSAGTPTYQAPELFESGGVVTPASDIYSFGTTLAFALSGVRPFVEEGFAQLAGAKRKPIDLRATSSAPNRLPQALIDLVARTTAPNPDQRPQATDVVGYLRAIEQGDTVVLSPARARASSPRVWRVLLLAAALIAAYSISGIFLSGPANPAWTVTAEIWRSGEGLAAPLNLADAPVVRLTRDDNYRFALQSDYACNFHVLQRDAAGAVTTLLPNPRFSSHGASLPAGASTRVPESEDAWLYLDPNSPNGREFVIVIGVRQTALEPAAVERLVGATSALSSLGLRKELTAALDSLGAAPCAEALLVIWEIAVE